jgi:hypothetical protein
LLCSLVLRSNALFGTVYIHQTPQKKAAGIQAIDQFLVRSKKMLICYNDDYFERLWCCFELAARASSGSKIEMLPLWRAPVVLVVLVGFTVAHIAEYIYILHAGTGGSPNGFMVVSTSFHLIPVLFMMKYTVLATRQKLKLTDTLRTFKIANTECFDPVTATSSSVQSRAGSPAVARPKPRIPCPRHTQRPGWTCAPSSASRATSVAA